MCRFETKMFKIYNEIFQNDILTLSLLSASFLRKKIIISPWKCINFDTWVLYDNFNKKLLLNFLVKIIIQNSVVKFNAEMVWLIFFLKNKALRSESVKNRICWIIEISRNIYNMKYNNYFFYFQYCERKRFCKAKIFW